ncbi:hypothetical protein SNE40_006684 [Patella caerulea]|uniref:Structure-specific endonuclease subunit SLX1 homolog n=1 Tax=Patella caerulea TaxID=87958 RepID=A0AAN8K359_PATCE
MVQEVEAFYGVYLLYNLNPKYKGRVYIGKTTDPNRRIHQHNTGAKAGGAWRTDGKGPWEMVLIIHGFPEAVSALRFEWAWQHPKISRRLRHLPGKRKTEKQYDFHFRIVSQMLRTAPWNRLSLTIRWLKQEFRQDFSPNALPPIHMPVEYGPIVCKKVDLKKKKNKKGKDEDSDESSQLENADIELQKSCAVCSKWITLKEQDITLSCLYPVCHMVAHIICLAKKFLMGDDHLIPIEGNCPWCSQTLLWGELIRHKQGCHTNLTEQTEEFDKGSGDYLEESETD